MPPSPARRRLNVASVARIASIGGDENRLLQTSLAFDPDDVRHIVFIIDRAADLSEREHARWQEMRAAYHEAGTEVVDLTTGGPGSKAGRAIARAQLVPRLIGEFRRRRVDVVDARMGLPGALAVPAAKAARVPVVTLTSYFTSLYSPPVRYLVGQAVVAGIDALISDARATLDDFEAWRWSHHAELALIPNGIQPATSELPPAEARRLLGLPTDPSVPIIGQISRVIPRKAFDVFLRAAALLHEREPHVHYAVIGFVSDDQRAHLQELRDLARELGIADVVSFVSHPGPVGDAFAAIDVFAHLSHADSSPFAIHEGMSAAKPSVITSLPGNLELVDDGETGMLVPPNDPAAAADAFGRLIKDPAVRERLGAGARQRYLTRHQPEVMAAAHVDLYRKILARKNGER